MSWVARMFMIAMGLAAAGLLLFGPKPTQTAPDGRIIIDYWEKWRGDEADRMRIIVDDFNRTVGAEKGIFVRYLSITNVDRKTLAATVAGVPPDIAGVWDGQVDPFARRGALLPLTELAREHGITRESYKRTYWEGCTVDGELVALVSTPAAVALHYNKQAFYERAAALAAAGLDPAAPPRTLAELDHYARVLDVTETRNGRSIIRRTGYLPMEPGWYINYTPLWFGGQVYDQQSDRFMVDSPAGLAAFEWVASYSRRLGADSLTQFRDGLSGFDNPQNPFMVGQLAIVQQGPWMANYIFRNKPSWSQQLVPWSLERFLPRAVRPFNYGWGVEAFPSAVEGQHDVTYAGFDALVIPRGSRHPREAFEFIAYVNRQDVMEKLCRLHCKNSPLAQTSLDFIRTHPNPYIDVFERLAASPNAHGPLKLTIGAEVGQEIRSMVELIYLLREDPATAVADTQRRLEEKLQRHRALERARR